MVPSTTPCGWSAATVRAFADYRKCHLFGELDRAMFRAGSGPSALVDLCGVRIGLLICYDVEFPESVRLLALAGADLVAVPTALMDPFEVVARTVVPARAIENQVFLAYANRCGREGDLRYCGQSCVVGPDGADLARAGRGEELILAELDLERLAAPAGTTPTSPTGARSCTARSPRPHARPKEMPRERTLQPAARRQRDAALRRAGHDDAAARPGDGGGPGRLLRRRAARHRDLEPQRHPLRPAPDPRRVRAAPPLQHGDPGGAVRRPPGRRHRRRRNQSLRPREIRRDHRGRLRRDPRAWLPAADARRRSHADAADPARHAASATARSA